GLQREVGDELRARAERVADAGPAEERGVRLADHCEVRRHHVALGVEQIHLLRDFVEDGLDAGQVAGDARVQVAPRLSGCRAGPGERTDRKRSERPRGDAPADAAVSDFAPTDHGHVSSLSYLSEEACQSPPLSSVTRPSGGPPDPWLCVPASRLVCLCQKARFVARPGTRKASTNTEPCGASSWFICTF